jgi:hypothetical protein
MASDRRSGGGALPHRTNLNLGKRRRERPRPRPPQKAVRTLVDAGLRGGRAAREAAGRALVEGARRLFSTARSLRAPAAAVLAEFLVLRGARRQQGAAVAVLAFAASFVVLIAGAMALYPGGTWMNRQTRGFDVVRNFFCDLSAAVALNGAPNPGASIASTAMVALALGLVPFWLLIAFRLREEPRKSAAVRALGLASAVTLPLVPLLPSARSGPLHVAAVLLASLPGLAAGGVAAAGLLASREARRPHGYLAGATLLAAVVTAALYLRLVETRATVPHWSLPAMQKVAAVLLVAWLVVTAETMRSAPKERLLVTARRRRGRSRRRPRRPSGP